MNGDGIDWAAARARLDLLARRLEGGGPGDAAILRQRAARLARPRAAPAAGGSPYVVFRRGAGRFAVPLAQVRETPVLRALRPVPGVPPHIAGLALVASRPLPVVELGWFLEAGIPAAAPTVLVVAEMSTHAFALAADRIEGVSDLPTEAAAAALRRTAMIRAFVAGITDDMVTIIDLEALAADSRFVVNDEVGGREG
ncbi:MAG: chemotaxis protein CheW [Alphaproteobacteria bacterium]